MNMDNGSFLNGFGGSIDWTNPISQTAKPDLLREAGANCEIKRFDSICNSQGDRILLAAGEKYKNAHSRAEQSALVLTKIWDQYNGDRLQSTKLEIKSPHMKAALKAVAPEFEAFDISARHITIKDEPHCLFHYRNELEAYGQAMQSLDFTAAQHVHFLLSYMWQEFTQQAMTYFASVELISADAHPSIDFPNLWTVFRPGDLVYVPADTTVKKRHEIVFKFRRMAYHENCDWTLHGHIISRSNQSFIHTDYKYSVSHYEGFRPLGELSAVPLHYHMDQEDIRGRLLQRGKKFVSFTGQTLVEYQGVARLRENLVKSPKAKAVFKSQLAMVNGRVISDRHAFDEANPHFDGVPGSMKSWRIVMGEHLIMKDDEYIICDHEISGYSLKDCRWGYFSVEYIRDAEFDAQAFNDLLLPDIYKTQILSLVEIHEDQRLQFDDLIRGKGKGIVFLLYGAPGLGKTLTAESVAERLKKPILRIDAGYLGTTAESVEEGLSAIFIAAEKWHAIVLLDEADVFLDQRKTTNLKHNSLVSVFLRVLEYYQGILFLTTNRVGSFDRAFKSRIHLAIHYKALSFADRRILWSTFLSRASPESAEALENNRTIEKLAAENLNGRQIKNLVRTASALALWDEASKGIICAEHIDMALGPMLTFEEDIEREMGDRDEPECSAGNQSTKKRRRLE